jgi:hypothetical protein
VYYYTNTLPDRQDCSARKNGWLTVTHSQHWHAQHGTAEERALLTESPVPLGRLWTQRVNQPQTAAELADIRRCVTRGQPFGGDAWRRKVARQHGLEHTFRSRGRPRKNPPASPAERSR